MEQGRKGASRRAVRGSLIIFGKGKGSWLKEKKDVSWEADLPLLVLISERVGEEQRRRGMFS